MEAPTGQTIFSGIQPSGTLHIGNYLGALKQWVALQENNTAYYCIVDLHAITVPYEPAKLAEAVLDAAALYLAAGVDPERSTMFVQSGVPAHSELAWLLATLTPLGELKRMTQFKDKEKALRQAQGKQASNLGLFAYPVLMAADILLYQASVVPVGHDQAQHVELTRTLAAKFNNTFGEMFTPPQAYIPESSARIMSLSDPAKKMSKSDSPKSYIALTDDADTITKKIMSAVTDTEAVFSFEKSGPAVKNLLAIYEAFSGEDRTAIETKFATTTYEKFKTALADLIIEQLEPLQTRYQELRRNDDDLRILLARGAHQAQQKALETMRLVRERTGLV